MFVVLGIVCLLGAGGSVFALVGNLSMSGEASASESWPSAPGTMLSANYVVQRGRGTHYYEVHASYEYVVAGATHRGNQVGFYKAGNFDDEADARAFVARYKAGAHVDVFYDPAAPDHAVLVRGGETVGVAAVVLFAAIGVAFLAAAIALLVIIPRRRSARGTGSS